MRWMGKVISIGLAGSLAACASAGTTPAPPLSPGQTAAISASIAAAEAIGTLAIERTKDPYTIKAVQAAQAALTSAWTAYQAQVANGAPSSTAAVDTALAALVSAAAVATAPAANSGASLSP